MTTLFHDQILKELFDARICSSPAKVRLESTGENPNRADFRLRHNFRVIEDDRVVCALTVGGDIDSLWTRANGLAAACPEIACKPIARRKTSQFELAAFEYFEGRNLEMLVNNRQLPTTNALAHAHAAWAALDRSSKPSSIDKATAELDAFFAGIQADSNFTALDRIFLQELVFPLIRTALLKPPCSTRWTNGDFIPRNILVGAAGQIRLIDCEFAAPTHFTTDDAWRWQTFNALPTEAHQLAVPASAELRNPGVEAYSLLRQLSLAHHINGALLASTDSQPALARLRELVQESLPAFNQSVFFSPFSQLKRLQLENEQKRKASETQHRENLRLARLLGLRQARLSRAENQLLVKTTHLIQNFWRRLSPPTPPRFQLHFDSPGDWRPSSQKILVRGWCFPRTPFAIQDLRIQIDNRTYDGIYGLERADVGQAHPALPGAGQSGFEVEIEIKPEDRNLSISVCDIENCWHTASEFDLAKPPDSAKGNYDHWIKAHDTLKPEDLSRLATEISALPLQPLISVILPVFNTPAPLLARAIASVQAQVYARWELCIADDASTAAHVRPLIERFAKNDPRIKTSFRESNGHIAAASNTALSLATGEYVALLDHDDELRPHALAEVARTINHRPDLILAYSDEDKIDDTGYRHAPHFKPDWMPDLFLGHNYLSHLCVCRSDVIRALGGWRTGFDGAQDWDLQLRLIEHAKPSQIVHIPHILYHWRAVPGSTALDTGEKSYAVDAARRAITEHFQRTKQQADLIHLPGNHWRAKYTIPNPAPLVSLIVPTRDGTAFLRRCISSILAKTTYPNYEIIVVDNQSSEPTALEYLRSLAAPGTFRPCGAPAIRVLPYAQEFNYSALNNFAVRAANGEFIGLLNNDVEIITPDWLEEMVSHADRPGIGCVGAMLLFPNDTIQHAGVVLGIAGHAGHAFKGFPRNHPGYMNHARLVKNYSAVTAACLVVRKSTYEQVGGLDESELAVSLNDVDLCLKVRAAGHRNLWTPFAQLYHHESATRGYEDSPEKKERFARERETLRKRWLPLLLNDPAYNPNLTAETEDFALGYPPRHDNQS